MLSCAVLHEEMINFELTTSVCKTDGAEGAAVYGLRAVRADKKKEFIEFADISCSAKDVEKLICRLQNNAAQLDQISYIVEDYIAEL